MAYDTNQRLLKIKHLLQYLSLSVAILVVWQALFQLGYIKPIILPPPSRIALTFLDLLKSGEMAKHLGISVLRVLEGFGIAALLGLSLGIAIGLSRTLDRLTDLVIQVIKPIPPIAWIPLAILWFGIGEQSKVYIIFLGAFFPVIINTIDGIRQTDHKFVEVARILEVPRRKFIGQMVIPGALPAIMTGIRIGLMVAWMCVVAAELIAASSGIGYLIMDARQLSQSDVVLVGMITIGVIGKLMDSVLKRLEKRLISWRISFAGD
ncbi:aliphatic sulfonates ABC transporter, membrane protein [Geotalea daltonii FRC-32]|uniref:Aliphatic sulfonates ABC transporter, membrane protein n=1 Tax=Geotalea daltonii (strain DSM 22248 / JCM 15807 / FRC-32) TaxID=316067 RepID=B9M637_GEODF|nr:ABC transporter permease [Geotalea daltonii]ACM20018.1 aliphatic sulfonates ABC transporter, membrane protein [Geotalea daltonii FRC-32]